jgi:hypothetical protein
LPAPRSSVGPSYLPLPLPLPPPACLLAFGLLGFGLLGFGLLALTAFFGALWCGRTAGA